MKKFRKTQNEISIVSKVLNSTNALNKEKVWGFICLSVFCLILPSRHKSDFKYELDPFGLLPIFNPITLQLPLMGT